MVPRLSDRELEPWPPPGWKVVPEAGLTLRPKGGLPMRLERR